MLAVEQIEEWLGQEVLDVHGEKVGKLEEVYYSSDGEATFVGVKSGLLVRRTSIVPVAGATVGRDYLKLGFSGEQIDQAGPGTAGDEILDGREASRLGETYGVEVAGQDLERASAINERRQAANEAQRRAEELDETAQRRAAEADEAQRAAQDAAAAATEKTAEAEQASQEAERAQAEAQGLT